MVNRATNESECPAIALVLILRTRHFVLLRIGRGIVGSGTRCGRFRVERAGQSESHDPLDSADQGTLGSTGTRWHVQCVQAHTSQENRGQGAPDFALGTANQANYIGQTGRGLSAISASVFQFQSKQNEKVLQKDQKKVPKGLNQAHQNRLQRARFNRKQQPSPNRYKSV